MKLYKVKFYVPEIYDFCEIALSEDEYNRYREVAEEARRDFMVDFPEDKDNAEAWQQYLEETISRCDFTIEISDEFSSQEAKVLWIDLDHPREVEDPDIPDEATMKYFCKALAEYNHLLKKVCREGLTDAEQDFVISCLSDGIALEPRTNIDFSTVVRSVPADVIAKIGCAFDPTKAYFCSSEDEERIKNALDITEVGSTLCIRFAKAEEMPEMPDTEDVVLGEHMGYYDKKAFQVILCPERIKTAWEQLAKKGTPEKTQRLYHDVFLMAMLSAIYDDTNRFDMHGNMVRSINK